MENFRTLSLGLKSILTKKNPFYVQFALSKNCNLNCKMCQAVETRKHEQELKLNQIEELAKILSRLGVVFLILTGGEPLLRKDLPEIIKIFTREKIAVRLQTNAINITKEKINALVKAGLKNVTVSLDSLMLEKQDFITGRPGSWQEIMKGIALFSQHLPKRGSFCGINIVVSKFNLDEIISLIKFSSQIGFYASLIPVHLSSRPEFIVRGTNKLFAFDKSDYEKIDNVYQQVIKLKKKGYLIYNSYKFLKESPDFLKYKKIHWRCQSPHLYFAISPSGGFLPCVDINMDEPMLGEQDFVKRYHSKEFKQKVRQVVEKCPGCLYACWPEVSYLVSDFSVLINRLLEGIKISQSHRQSIDFSAIIKLAEASRDFKI